MADTLMTPPTPVTPAPAAVPAPGGANTAPPVNDKTPKSFKISYDEGETPTEFSVEGDQAASEPSAFKFEQLDALKDSHSDLYKSLKAELSAKSRYSKAFKTPEEATALTQRLERLTERVGGKGLDLDAVEAAINRSHQQLEAARAGDKAVIENWFKESPEGMGDFVLNALEQLPKVDAKLSGSISGKAFISALQQKDIYGQSALDALNALYQHVSDKPEAAKLLERVAATVNQQNTGSQYKPDNTARVTAQLEKREAAVFAKQVDLAADEVVRPAAGKALAALTAEMKGITADERREYREFLTQEFYRQLAKDNNLKQKYHDLVKAKDQDGIVQLLKGARGKVMNEAAKALYRSKLINRQKIQEEASAKGEPSAGGIPAAQGKMTSHWQGKIHPEKGPQANFDYDRMNREGIQAMDRLFYVKGDKRLFSW